MDRLRDSITPIQNPTPAPPHALTPAGSRRSLPAGASAKAHWEAGRELGLLGKFHEAAQEFASASMKDPNLTAVEFVFQGHHFYFADCPGSQDAAYILQEVDNLYAIEKLDLKAGDVVVDIGAHLGFVSIILAKLYPGIKVFSYEPSRGRFPLLLQNIRDNRVEGITAVNKGVAGKTGTLELHISQSNIVVSEQYYAPELNPMIKKDEWRHDTIDCVSLDDLFAEHEIDACRWMKVDCEGAEYEILLNATVLDRVREIGMELHVPPANVVTAEEVLQFLSRSLIRRYGRNPSPIRAIQCQGATWTDLVMGLMNAEKALAA